MAVLVFKVIGAVIIIFASAAIGALLSRNCSQRVFELRAIQSLLKQFENEIVFLSNPIADAFIKISSRNKNSVGSIFKDTADCLNAKKGATANEAWEAALLKNKPDISLNSEDAAILQDFGKMLGCSDRNGQVSNINMAIEKLKVQEEKAEEIRRKYEGMYKKLGILGGLAIVVMLF